jgi:hypothetical protein
MEMKLKNIEVEKIMKLLPKSLYQKNDKTNEGAMKTNLKNRTLNKNPEEIFHNYGNFFS